MSHESSVPDPLSGGSSSAYHYESLPECGYIRLMRLLPGNHEDPLVCTLFATNIKQAPGYEALSYVWGNGSTNLELECGQGVLKITANLDDALRQMRRTAEARIIWVDAICIDQSNVLERGHQVNQMGRVYASADRVLIWLGKDDDDDAEDAFSLMAEMNGLVEAVILTNTDIAQLIDSLQDTLLKLSKWQAVRGVFARPWFTRVWVLQEVGLARTALVLCGNLSMAWSDMVQFAHFCSMVAAEHRPLYDIIDERRYLQIASKNFANSLGKTFFYTMMIGCAFEATNARDKVFAFLGHPSARTKAGDRPLLEADYTKPSSKVFWELTIAMLYELRSLDVLSSVVHGSSADLETSFPSWVRSWDSRSVNLPIEAFKFVSPAMGHFQAGLGFERNRRFVLRHKPGQMATDESIDSHLHASGSLFDSVSCVSNRMWESDFGCKSGQQMGDGTSMNPVQSAWTIAEISKAGISHLYPDEELAFALTLVVSLDRTKLIHEGDKDATTSLRANFRAYCQKNFTPECYQQLEKTVKIEMQATSGDGGDYGNSARMYCANRKFFKTAKGRYGVGLHIMKQGDQCCILFGASVPFILRPTSDRFHYKLVGECYIHGVMQGEVVQDWKMGLSEVQTLILV